MSPSQELLSSFFHTHNPSPQISKIKEGKRHSEPKAKASLPFQSPNNAMLPLFYSCHFLSYIQNINLTQLINILFILKNKKVYYSFYYIQDRCVIYIIGVMS